MENNLIKNIASVPGHDAKAPAKSTFTDTAVAEIFICDECGDTLWDAVLAQENKTSNPEG